MKIMLHRHWALLISIMVLLSSVSLFGTGIKKRSIFAEGKIGSEDFHGVMPMGFGAGVVFPMVGDAARWGIEGGIMAVSSWADTLDLSQSPDSADTVLYDIWTKNGTDINLYIGPRFQYRFDLAQEVGLSASIGGGALINISAYDETKKSYNPPPLYSVSEMPTETSLYFKPRLSIQYKKVYLAYEYFGATDDLEHVICLGVVF